MAKIRRSELEALKGSAGKEDNRVFCRLALGDVGVRFKDLKGGEKGNFVCKDISGGGAGIESAREIRPRTPLEMWFDLPDGFEPMHVVGKVAWSHLLGVTWKLGVAFDKLKLVGMSRILKWGASANE
jgi:hypothetical protein